MSRTKDVIAKIIANARTGQERERILRLVLRFPTAFIQGGALLCRGLAGLRLPWTKRCPDTVFFFITNTCNQKCVHCFYASEINTSHEQLAVNEIKKICRSIAGKTTTVFLCGGEPTTREDLPEIAVEFIETAKVERLFITSNGILQRKLIDTVTAVLASKRNFQLRVPISLDGPEHIHDAIRRHPGGYQKAMATLQALIQISEKDPRLVPLTTTVIQKANVDVFMDFYKFLKSTIGDRVQFTFIRQDARDAGGLDKNLLLDAGSSENSLPSIETCRRILDEICRLEKTRPSVSCMSFLGVSFLSQHLDLVERHAPVASPCIAPHSFATIYPNGQLSLCEVVKPFVDLKKFNYDLIQGWNSSEADLQRKQLAKCWCTYPCALGNSIMRHPSALAKSVVFVKSVLLPQWSKDGIEPRSRGEYVTGKVGPYER
ncbi:MAG: radical SAM protein [Candidatus Omnitrophica bacterium]|nr:radical SAM protein [Candidatus Omnitrophota bacterium]